MTKTVVIVGVGEGLGKSLAKKFGQKGYNLVLLARNRDHLEKIQAELHQEKIESQILLADVSNSTEYAKALNQIKEQEIVGVLGAYQTADVLHDKLENNHGFIIFTGGIVAINPFPGFIGLNVGKAALRSLAQSLYQDWKADNVFVGTVTVGGVIKENTHFAPDLIAEEFIKLAENREDCEVIYQ